MGPRAFNAARFSRTRATRAAAASAAESPIGDRGSDNVKRFILRDAPVLNTLDLPETDIIELVLAMLTADMGACDAGRRTLPPLNFVTIRSFGSGEGLMKVEGSGMLLFEPEG